MIDMLPFAQQVADLLGIGYKASPYKNTTNASAVIRRNDEDTDHAFGLVLTHLESDGRIKIRGEYPTANDGTEFPWERDKTTSIYVADTRSPKSIAGDILRKLLPSYEASFLLGIKLRNEHNAYTDNRDGLAQRFATILHGKVSQSKDRVEGGPLVGSKLSNLGYLNDLYVSGTSKRIDISLSNVPAELAERILAVWLEDWTPECRNCHTRLDHKDICQNIKCSKFGKSGLSY